MAQQLTSTTQPTLRSTNQYCRNTMNSSDINDQGSQPPSNKVQCSEFETSLDKSVKRAQPIKMNSPFNTYQMPVIEASEGVAAFESIESLKVLCAQALDQKMADLLQQKAQLELENRELRRLANTDELTQVANRRFFDQQLQQEWQRLRRDRQVCSLILLDIDYFKRYNDFYGHQAGDSCLMQIAKAIQGAVKRPADFVARYGGEEFAIVLPNTCTAGALAVAERVQQAIEAQKISHEQSDISQFVTVSMGVSSLMPTVEGCVEMLIARADAALYTAKQLGRKRYYPYLDSVELES